MSLFDMLGGAGTIIGAGGIAEDMRETGQNASDQMGNLAAQLQDDAAFTGFGVTTGLGNSEVGADGSMNLGVGQDQGMMDTYGAANAASMQAMQNAMGDTAGREQTIYDRAMAMQQPGLDANAAMMQSQEAARGRTGVAGSQFGGSGEDAAMARAQAGASNSAAFQAMNQGQQEMMNQAQMAQGFGGMANQAYGNSFMPMQQQLNAMQTAQQGANMAQTGQLTGANLAAQLGLGGIQTQVNADAAAANLYGNMFSSGMNAIGNIGSGQANAGFFNTLKNFF